MRIMYNYKVRVVRTSCSELLQTYFVAPHCVPSPCTIQPANGIDNHYYLAAGYSRMINALTQASCKSLRVASC